MKCRIFGLMLAALTLSAADFQTGQAARAVLGQSTFTSRDPGITATSLAVSGNRLYAADIAHRLLTFDLSKIPDSREDLSTRSGSGCPVCGIMPISSVNQSVMTGLAAFSVWGKTVVLASPATHTVLIWRDTTSGRIDHSPDLVLGRSNEASDIGPGMFANPVSVATDGKRLFVGDAALHRVLVWNSLPATDDQPADAVLGQPDFFSTAAAETPLPDSVTTPAALVSDGTNLFVADTAGRRILVFSPADAPLPNDAIVNSASFLNGAVAPGTLVTVNGKNLSEEWTAVKSEDDGGPLPKILGGTQLIFDGQALPLIAVSASQIQSQIPYDVGTATAASIYVRVQHANGAVTVTAPAGLRLVPASPGLFAFDGDEPRGGILLHSGSADANAANGTPVTEESPAEGGELLTVWATGLGAISETGSGPVTAVPVIAQIDGQMAHVVSAKLPQGSVGVYEIRVAVPTDLNGNAQAHLSVGQNGIWSNTVTFPLNNRP